MALFDWIEKLINEHGSSVILKEQLSFLKDQFAVSEKKLSVSEKKAADSDIIRQQLESKNTNLEQENKYLRDKVDSLEQVISDFHKKDLIFKYGVYWNKEGHPHCNICKSPVTNFTWSVYFNSQVSSLLCHCSPMPIILIDKGTAIQATDAMKEMARG